MWQFSDWSMANHSVIGPTITAKASVMCKNCGTVTFNFLMMEEEMVYEKSTMWTHVIINSMQQSSWEAVTQSQNVLPIMKLGCSLHFSLILTQTNSIHKLTPHFLKTYLTILSRLFPSGFYSNILEVFNIILHCRLKKICPASFHETCHWIFTHKTKYWKNLTTNYQNR